MDLTSMSDLTFLLLITFIITFPMIEQGVTVKLPKGSAQETDATKRTSSVTIDRDGALYLGTERTTPEALREALAMRFAENPDTRLLLRGDVDTNYGRVAEIARMARELGISQIALATSGETR